MPTVTSDARFLGLDLHSLGREVRQAWADALRSPLLSWLTPDAPVLLWQADGGQSVWLSGHLRPADAGRDKPRFHALQLPEDLLLRRTQVLPPMDGVELPHAAALQARALSPFAASDLAWGYRVQAGAAGGQQLELVLASRRQVTHYLQSQAARLNGTHPEIWALQPTGAPILLQGYGEAARRTSAATGRWQRCALLGLALLLLAGIAATPSLQLRQRAHDAYAAHQTLAQHTAPLVQQREALLQSISGLQALAELQAGRIEPLRVLNQLTQVLPDDTALQSFSLKGQKVTIAGLTANASTLMQLLSQQGGVHDVRAPSPAVRSGVDARENFTIEFMADPKVFGVAPEPVAKGQP